MTDLRAAGAVTRAGQPRRRDVSARDVIAARKVLHDTVADVLKDGGTDGAVTGAALAALSGSAGTG